MDKQQTVSQEQLATNIAHVYSVIAEAAERVGRTPDEITLVAVSKTVPIELVRMAYNLNAPGELRSIKAFHESRPLGVTNFGENRVQDALPKIAVFHPQDVRWHMIGHLQSNKAGKVVGAFDAVQSVDSLHLAKALNRHAEVLGTNSSLQRRSVGATPSTSAAMIGEGKRLPVLLQVNISGEASKEGMSPAEMSEVARQIAALPYIDVQGLMTIAPLVKDPEEARPVFRGLRALRDRLRDEVPQCSWQHLSMGMTDDYSVAIEEGATIVRIGRAIFGKRPIP